MKVQLTRNQAGKTTSSTSALSLVEYRLLAEEVAKAESVIS